MGSDVTAADMAACMSRGYEVQQLAARVDLCLGRVEKVLGGFREIQLLDWQSPAGRAYRNSVALQEVALEGRGTARGRTGFGETPRAGGGNFRRQPGGAVLMAEVTPSGSGGPIQLTGPAVDGRLEIRGGIGGISFQLEELIGGAEKLDAAAVELAAVEVEVRRIWEDLCPVPG